MMSPIGTSRTCGDVRFPVAIGGKAVTANQYTAKFLTASALPAWPKEGTGGAFLHLYAVFVESGMSKRSKELRRKAASELRSSRNGGSQKEKAAHRKRAAALKSLADNEEWLEGEKSRPIHRL